MRKYGTYAPTTPVEDIKIDLDKVPKLEMDSLCRMLVKAMKKHFDDPENMRKFEEWREQYKNAAGA